MRFDVRRDMYVMIIQVMTSNAKAAYKNAKTLFPHLSLPNKDTRTTTQASQPANHYGAVRGGM